jgi:hypothetical protein
LFTVAAALSALATFAPESTAQGLAGVFEESVIGTIEFGVFGGSLALQDDLLAVGHGDYIGLSFRHDVTIYARMGSGWTQQAVLTGSDGPTGLGFGLAVDLDGDRIAVGAPMRSMRTGAVYVFERSGTSWTEQEILVPQGATTYSRFGTNVAVSGDTVVTSSVHANTAFAFDFDGTSWSEHELQPPDMTGIINYGERIAVCGDTVVVLSWYDPDTPNGSSQAGYVFQRSGTSWAFQQKLLSSDATFSIPGDVHVAGDLVFVANLFGTVAVFERSAGVYSETAMLRPPVNPSGTVDIDFDGEVLAVGMSDVAVLYREPVDGGATGWEAPVGVLSPLYPNGSGFGSSVAVSAGRLAVGVLYDATAETGGGGFDVFELVDVAVGNEEAELVAGDPFVGAQLGRSVAVDGDTAVFGAHLDGGSSGPGAAYVFGRVAGGWVQQAKLTASDGAGEQRFGYTVVVEGDTIVVSGHQDGDAVGAAYVFERSAGIWGEVAKLTAPDGGTGDRFGRELALCGDRLVIAAPRDSNLNGFEAGSVYVYERNGTTWGFTAKLRSSDGFANQKFGLGVSLHGTTLAVGAFEANFQDGASIYVLEIGSGAWVEEERLRFLGQPINLLGTSFAVGPDLLVAGTTVDAPGLYTNIGEVATFVRSGTTWLEQDRMRTDDAFPGENFGSALALEGDRLVVGEGGNNGGATDSGAAHVFVRDGTGWNLERVLVAATSEQGAELGGAIAVAGDIVVAGARFSGLGEDDAGAGYVFNLTDLFPSFCDASDGSLASCPCGNLGNPDTGCDIQQATGGIGLEVTAQATSVQNRATLMGTGFPPMSAPGVTVIRGAGLDPASPAVFGDGLLCISVPVVRVGATLASGGVSLQTVGHGAAAGAGTFFYQLWARNIPAMFCTPDGFNLSNGRAITW